MEKVLAVLASIWEAIKPYIPQLTAFLAGREWEKGKQAERALSEVDEAARAAARVELLSSADVMRELEQRGLRRLPDQPPERQ